MNFDRLAPYYDSLASWALLGSVKKSQLQVLKKYPPRGRVLLIGGGTGWIVRAVINNGVDRLYYLEESHEMIKRAMDSCPQAIHNKVTFIEGDETALPDGPFDVIITNFFLDCFDPARLVQIVKLLRSRLTSGGHWYLTDFRLDDRWYQRWWQAAFVTLMIRFFKATVHLEAHRLEDFESLLTAQSMKVDYQRLFFGGMIQGIVLTDCT